MSADQLLYAVGQHRDVTAELLPAWGWAGTSLRCVRDFALEAA